jgi:putative addiction module CopG family antidote
MGGQWRGARIRLQLEYAMQVSIPPEIEKLIEERVNSGRYGRPEDVVAAAVVSLEQRERASNLSRAELEAVYPGLAEKLAAGLASAAAGRVSDGEAFFDELEHEEAAAEDQKTRRTA